MSVLPENNAIKMTVQRNTVETKRRKKVCALEGPCGLDGSAMGAKSIRRDKKSQRDLIFERPQRQNKKGRNHPGISENWRSKIRSASNNDDRTQKPAAFAGPPMCGHPQNASGSR
jgi:hypothetical protein